MPADAICDAGDVCKSFTLASPGSHHGENFPKIVNVNPFNACPCIEYFKGSSTSLSQIKASVLTNLSAS